MFRTVALCKQMRRFVRFFKGLDGSGAIRLCTGMACCDLQERLKGPLRVCRLCPNQSET